MKFSLMKLILFYFILINLHMSSLYWSLSIYRICFMVILGE